MPWWHISVRSQKCSCLVTWFCYQLIAKPGNKTAAPSWPDPYGVMYLTQHWFRWSLGVQWQTNLNQSWLTDNWSPNWQTSGQSESKYENFQSRKCISKCCHRKCHPFCSQKKRCIAIASLKPRNITMIFKRILDKWESTGRCRYNAVGFLTNIHKIQPIARVLGRGMGCLLWFQHLIDVVSLMFCFNFYNHQCNILQYWTDCNWLSNPQSRSSI